LGAARPGLGRTSSSCRRSSTTAVESRTSTALEALAAGRPQVAATALKMRVGERGEDDDPATPVAVPETRRLSTTISA
jgi:hypothetical protein